MHIVPERLRLYPSCESHKISKSGSGNRRLSRNIYGVQTNFHQKFLKIIISRSRAWSQPQKIGEILCGKGAKCDCDKIVLTVCSGKFDFGSRMACRISLDVRSLRNITISCEKSVIRHGFETNLQLGSFWIMNVERSELGMGGRGRQSDRPGSFEPGTKIKTDWRISHSTTFFANRFKP